MRSRIIGGFGVAATFIAAGLSGAPAVGAPQPITPQEIAAASTRHDKLPNPLAEKQEELTKQAIGRIVSGQTKAETRNGSTVARVGGKWVELKKKADKTDPIFTILSQFGNEAKPGTGEAGNGPLHNAIAAPTAEDNTTFWKSDFNQAHFNQMVNGPGESMADFYYKQSGGKYSVSGYVSDWVQLQYNGGRYGYNANEAEGYWNYVNDTIDAWYDAQVAAGKTVAQIDAQLAQFDVWDRFDIDGDGNFNEPDGYLDHFQAIHAGEGEEAGGGTLGDDAIWSHRWAAFQNGGGPDGNGPVGFPKVGGARIGQSKYWVRDYTTEPENGGLGVFAHEYGHDLGLPDFYDTQGGDNSSGYWTLMSGGSWMSHDPKNIGTSPIYMGPEEKLFLGWLDYVVAPNGSTKNITLGSAATPEGPLPQAVLVPLPDQSLSERFNTPKSGSNEWWSGYADNLDTSITRELDLAGATNAKVKASVWFNIEPGCQCDQFYVQASGDGGSTWTDLVAPRDGDSTGWQDEEYDLAAFVGKKVQFRFRYTTDGGLHLKGAYVDDISLVTDATAGGWSDDVEAGTGGWTAKGFTRNDGNYIRTGVKHFYLAEFRTYTGYDKSLKVGPYNFGDRLNKPDTVQHFPYQDGLLVWYVNYGFDDNNTIVHPGGGRALPVDARPAPILHPDGGKVSNARQVFDATFGKQKTDAVTFIRNGVPQLVPSQPAITTFNDSDPNRYWSAANPLSSVKVAGDGVRIQVLFEMNGFLPIMIVRVTN